MSGAEGIRDKLQNVGIKVIDGAQNGLHLVVHAGFERLKLLGVEKVGDIERPTLKHILSRSPS